MLHPRLIETRTATLERTAVGLVEVRFKPDVRLDAEGLAEVVRAKQSLCAAEAADILMVLPPEVDFDLGIMGMDHHALNGGCGQARRLALAAQSTFNERLAGIYFRYHPRENATAVFFDEGDARHWLSEGVPEASLA